jgi:hypothetical protein
VEWQFHVNELFGCGAHGFEFAEVAADTNNPVGGGFRVGSVILTPQIAQRIGQSVGVAGHQHDTRATLREGTRRLQANARIGAGDHNGL